MTEQHSRPLEVALFVTCLADLMRPSVARASLQLLEDAGCQVAVPRMQTCCGQPQYNSGDYPGAIAIAKKLIAQFEHYPYTVVPSGSCAGMLVRHYPKILDGEWRQRAESLSQKTFELTAFLDTVCDYRPTPMASNETFAYHDACAGLRELGIREQPRRLLRKAGLEMRELPGRDVCCGFGGTFCAKMPDISAKMADDKLLEVEESGVTTLVAGDLGCLFALAGRASRTSTNVRCRHVAEILVGDTDGPAIGEPEAR